MKTAIVLHSVPLVSNLTISALPAGPEASYSTTSALLPSHIHTRVTTMQPADPLGDQRAALCHTRTVFALDATLNRRLDLVFRHVDCFRFVHCSQKPLLHISCKSLEKQRHSSRRTFARPLLQCPLIQLHDSSTHDIVHVSCHRYNTQHPYVSTCHHHFSISFDAPYI